MKKRLLLLSLLSFSLIGCTNPSLNLTKIATSKGYTGEATVLIAVEGTDDREVRHIQITTDQEPEGLSVYFKENKTGEGFLSVLLPTPSTHVRLSQYSLTGMYGCSRGNDGYGFGEKILPSISNGKTYFLGTINTSMNTTYKQMPQFLYQEAKSKYHYTPHGTDIKRDALFNYSLD